jgi:hypothetical protein
MGRTKWRAPVALSRSLARSLARPRARALSLSLCLSLSLSVLKSNIQTHAGREKEGTRRPCARRSAARANRPRLTRPFIHPPIPARADFIAATSPRTTPSAFSREFLPVPVRRGAAAAGGGRECGGAAGLDLGACAVRAGRPTTGAWRRARSVASPCEIRSRISQDSPLQPREYCSPRILREHVLNHQGLQYLGAMQA